MTENRRHQTVTDGGQKALPEAISDAIDAYGSAERTWQKFAVDETGEARAALERAIAEHVVEQVRKIPTAFMQVPKGDRFAIAVKDTLVGRELSKWSKDLSTLREDLGAVFQVMARQKGHEAGPEFGCLVEDSEHVAPVDAPTEAEIEEALDAVNNWGHMPPGAEAIAQWDEVEALLRSLMRRAAAAKTDPSALDRLRERVEEEIDRNHRNPMRGVARAAERCLDGSEVDGWHTPLREVDVDELREALGELEREEGP